MKLCIAGSRSITDYKTVKAGIEEGLKALKIKKKDIKTVISGHANGVDKLGEKWAIEELKLKPQLFEADWKNIKRAGAVVAENKYGKYDKIAGLHRNEKMGDYADIAIVIHDGSSGSAHMIEVMKNLNKPVFEKNLSEIQEGEEYYAF